MLHNDKLVSRVSLRASEGSKEADPELHALLPDNQIFLKLGIMPANSGTMFVNFMFSLKPHGLTYLVHLPPACISTALSSLAYK